MEISDLLIYGGVAFLLYYLATQYFKSAHSAQIPRVPSRKRLNEKRDFTVEELGAFDGSDPTSPILMGVKGKVYDVTTGAGFYGPGGAYHAFAGKDASRALGKGVTDEDVANSSNLDDLTPSEKEALDEWESHYQMKYEVVGNIVAQHPNK